MEKTSLSKNVLRMKVEESFYVADSSAYNKSALRIEREKHEEEQQRNIDDEHWVMDLPEYQRKETRFQKDMGYRFCEELDFGRLSYKGFNVEIEKLMKINQSKKSGKETTESEEKVKKDEDEVDDEEMTNRYSSLIGVIAKKFAKKRPRVSKEEEKDETLIDELPPHKFMKPTLDD